MRPSHALVAALAVAAAACATDRRVARRPRTLPPPARESRAGAGHPGAGPALVAVSARPAVQARRPPHDAAVRRAVETAAVLFGRREIVLGGVRYGDDCAALVRAAFHEAGEPLPDGTDARALHALASARGALRRRAPAPGDVVFLADRPGGAAEHVGLVESVSPDGTAVVIHRAGRGVARLRVNAARPGSARSGAGKALNDLVVVGSGRITAGRLLVGFATLL